jgi:hypothetical protein
VLLLGACGYHLPGRQDPARPVPRIHMAPITNGTFRPNLEGQVASAVSLKIQLEARAPLTDEGQADLVLSGRVTGYGVEALAVDQTDIGRRFRVRVTAAMTVRERAEQRLRFQGSFFGEAYYTVGDTVQSTRAAEDEAIRRASQGLAGQFVARLLEEW